MRAREELRSRVGCMHGRNCVADWQSHVPGTGAALLLCALSEVDARESGARPIFAAATSQQHPLGSTTTTNTLLQVPNTKMRQ